ncbi:unnamed protein product [Mytilus coruscus]|uniref:Uncharacterized protein n=1 Tax=Mytilus coruscus TaxID=42192 RepID=A0A6J8BNY5_MYTCO|nr:unnamed protein product [Mytilus coruscus]
MGNTLSKPMKEAAGDHDIFQSNAMVLDTSEKDAQAAAIAAINMTNQISENKYLDSGAFGNHHNPSGQACKTDDENLGCSSYTNQGKVDAVNLKHMKGSGDKNLPYPLKDVGTFERSDEYKSKVIPEHNQILGSSMDPAEDRQMQIHGLDEDEIYNAMNNRNTIKIPDLEDDMGIL